MSSEQKCAVPGCIVDQSHPNVKWFTLPDQTSLISSVRDGTIVYYCRRRLWLEKLGLSDGPLEKYAAVCSTHFTEEDFVDDNKGNAVLKDDAVPSLNLPPRTDLGATDPLSQSNDNPDSNRNVNDIETVEKSDEEDDDVEIIEPHREIITLDDDDANDKDAEPVAKNETPKGSLIVKSFANINSTPIEKVKKVKAQTAKRSIVNKGPDKESSSNLKCMSPEAITHSLKGAINKQPSAVRSETPQSTNSLLKKQLTIEKEPAQSENGNVQCHYMISEGKKYLIQMTKPSALKTPQPTVSPKTATLQTDPKLIPVPVYKDKKGPMLTTKDMSKALKKQLIEWVQQTPHLKDKKKKTEPKSKVVTSPMKAVRVINVSQPNKNQTIEGNSPQVAKSPADTSKRTLLKLQNGKAIQTSTETGDSQAFSIPTSSEGFIPLPNGFVGKIISQNPVPPLIYLPQTNPPSNKVPIPRLNSKKTAETKPTEGKAEKVDAFKFVSIDEIMKNKIINEETPQPLNQKETAQPAKKKCEPANAPANFSEIFNFVRKTMLGFVLDVFGRKYVLKECGLNFEPLDSLPGDTKKVALISATSISSTDKILLNAMHSYTSYTEVKETTKKGANKTDKTLKNEGLKVFKVNSTIKNNYIENKISPPKKEKIMIPPPIPNIDKKIEPKKTVKAPPKKKILKPTKDQNVTVVTKNEKVVITPKFVNVPNQTQQVENKPDNGSKLIAVPNTISKSIEEEMCKEKKNINRKKICKASLARTRRILKLPVSQMQPTFRGRLPVDRNRFRKIKKFSIEPHDDRKPYLNAEALRLIEAENKDSIPKKRTLKRQRLEADDLKVHKTSPIRTRSATRGQKKNYRNLSVYGTTEVVKKTKTERKNLSLGESQPKKLKYSDKVGDIESFLEVVLEPDNKELIHNSNVMEATMNGDGNNVE